MRTSVALLVLIVSSPLSLWSQEKDSVAQGARIVYPTKRVRPPNLLPSEIETWLDQQYSSWEWVNNYVIFEYTHPDDLRDYPFNPNCINGDFNDDGQKDYVVQIAQDDSLHSKHLFIAFLATEKGFKHHILETNPGYRDHYLWLSKKGTTDYDYDSQSEFTFPTDAITIVIWEKAAISYLFQNGKFVSIVTAD